MNQKVYSIPLLVILLSGFCLNAQTTWTGTVSDNWNQVANWTNGMPGPFNEPTIPAVPSGAHFPSVYIFTYFNFNVQNFGTLTVNADGGVSLFGTFINHGNASLILANNATNFLVEGTGSFENHGVVTNNGTFSNEGAFLNGTNGVFNNNFVYSHSEESFQNLGSFNNFGELFSEANFQNNGIFNNFNLLNNNDNASNLGIINNMNGATLRNDLNFVNQSTGTLNISGTFLNNNDFLNRGQIQANANSVVTNSFRFRNAANATWNSQGLTQNVFCAIYENKGTHLNTGVFENEGIIYADSPISNQQPTSTGSSVVITPTNFGTLCHDFTVGLAANNLAAVEGLDVANDQLDFCTDWIILVNGQPIFNFTGCASLGNHTVNVTFTDPFGRTTNCPAVVTVVDDLAPIIACQPTQTVQPIAGQCTATLNLAAPSVTVENCSVTSITNNAPPLFSVGPTLVTWTVTDQNGNATNCIQLVQVVDNLPPTINCPPNKSVSASPGLCGLSNQASEIVGDPAFAFDNCGTPTLTNNAPTVLPIGTSTLTWTATDAFGNTDFCQHSITVVDNQVPVISACPPDISVESQGVDCQAVATWGAAFATDNCGVPTQVFSISSGSIFQVGTTPVTVLVSDASLNTATCTFSVTVADTQAPVWSNCPANSSITLLDCGDVAVGNWTPPTATDLCLGDISSNFSPGDVLPVGPNNIVYTATDLSGNSSTCSFVVNVIALLALDCPSDIVVNIEPGETASPVSWNVPPGATNCTICASTSIAGFQFLGEKTGHRYYAYLGGQVSWTEASNLATQHGGYLVTIGDLLENEFLRKEFPAFMQTAWIGLSDEAVEGQFAWSNGEPSVFNNWPNGVLPINDQLDFVVLRNDGSWFDAGAMDLQGFLMEVPCYALDVTASNTTAFNNMVFPLGSTTISYEVTDNCGNTCACDFQVQVVQNQQVEPCVSKGDSQYGWIDNVQTEGFDNPSGDDGGRGNYTNSVFQLPDPGCIIKLTPGGPAVNNYLYWRIWADLNMDGDFFDENEVLGSLEGVGVQDLCYDVLANLPTGPVGMRIAMSRWDYAAACGSYLAGEAEDYVVEFVDSSLFNPNLCAWSFGLLEGAVEDLSVKLNWLGNGNCDVRAFQVERSEDGLEYEVAGAVLPISSGQLPTLYEFEDKTPYYGTNFYRIRVLLEDSTEVVSNLFETEFNVDLAEVFLFPNPATTEAILHLQPYSGKPVRIFIANASGQIVFDAHYEVLENEPFKLDLSSYATGIYTLYLKADLEREQVRRLVVTSR